MKRVVLGVCLWLLSCMVTMATQVDTVVIRSEVMQRDIKAVVVLPQNYEQAEALPVLYLLHGHGGNYANWITRSPELPELADRYKMIVVCPDGGLNSWYWDSPEKSSYRFEQYVALEIPAWIDANYKTIASREGRAISGLSMGGHGALYLAFRHQDTFGAAGSTAGGVDIRPFPLNWGMAEHLGAYASYPERWDQHTVINMLHLLTPGALKLIIDCGTEDFFYPVNETFHRKLLDHNIDHTYITGPGKHDWNYWNQSIRQQMQFFYYHFYGQH